MARLIFAIAVTWLLLQGGSAAADRDAELVMFESPICEWCELWHNEVGGIYGKTPEGQRVPLRRVNVHDPIPQDLEHLATGNFTPTFILLHRGREVGRIRGYPGEDFFWALFAELIKKLPEAVD